MSSGSSRDKSGANTRLDAAKMEYLQRLERGERVDLAAFLEQYPDVRSELVPFLAKQQRVANQAVPALIVSSTPAATFPRSFGNYTLLREIGRGGMGIVCEARQLNPDRTVAVKMILAGHLATQKDIERFQQEAQTAAELQHSNIVTIFEVGEHKRRHYFTMEYIAGESLGNKVRRSTVPAEQAGSYVKTAAEAIGYAHERGKLHRDLKPSNILIDSRNEPIITDFGLSKRLDGTKGPTITGELLGTPNYMSPEQADGKQLGPTSDLYSLGAVLYELLTGRPPFQSDSIKDTLWMVCHNEPIEPSKLNPKTPKDLETICLKCLDKDPQRRYQAAQELADDLGRYLHGEPVKARRIGPHERVWRWCRRNPVVAGLLVAVLLAASLGTRGVIWQLGETKKALANTRAAQTQRVLAQVDALLTAEPEAVPTILENLQPFRTEAMPRLREICPSHGNRSRERF